MNLTNYLTRQFLNFQRFGLCVDRYCAEKSGNKEELRDAVERIARIDRELDILEINSREERVIS